MKTAEEGIVEDVIFRGSSLEVKVKIHGAVLSAFRSVNDKIVEIGEKVDVFVYRMIVIDGENVKIVDNQTLKKESVII